jgi:tRNA threonylcarbamoyladenosine biosynthesis protein TsaB
MSNIIGIDTSSFELGIGLVKDNEPILGISRYMRNSHAEHISMSVDFLLTSCNISPSEITHVGIAVGPGSFTGLRIGISFIKGFCFSRSIKVLPVSSLESMAYSINIRERPIVTACDARSKEVFCARFEPCGNGLTRKSEDALVTIDRFMNMVSDTDTVVIDSLGYAKSTVFDFLDKRPNTYNLEHHQVQRGLTCAKIAMMSVSRPDAWIDSAELMPRYLNVTSMEKKLADRR